MAVEGTRFSRTAVIGIGLIGGSFALAGREAGILREVVGVARSAETLREAVVCGAADATTRDPVEAVREAEMVFIATPVAAIPEIINAIGPAVAEGCLVTDAGSTKRRIMEAARGLPDGVDFVGGHPMAGSERAGIAAARADLFRGSAWLLTPQPGGEAALTRMRDIVEALGARPVVVDAETHDRIVARTSHLPHLVAAALCGALGDAAEDHAFVGGGLRDTTRIAAGPVEVWREILLTNADEVLAALDELLEEAERYREALRAGDEDALTALLAEARRRRERMAET
ncbi:MAG: prephenate dehydrogenase/arogenate dehydrogenase family protein [Armatimonadota bacterium]|nr:prephenate dehydrogenase/arogenate dehydrogenase family protein [Armatimonadota bacterium]